VAAAALGLWVYRWCEPLLWAIAASATSATTSRTTPMPVIVIMCDHLLDLANFSVTRCICKSK